MKPILITRQFQVYDDVLPAQDFEALWRYVESEPYMPVHARGWHKVWRMSDGHPFISQAVQAGQGAGRSEEGGARPYPTGQMIDVLIRLLLDHARDFEELVGRRDQQWSAVTACSFLYPPGTALSWHTDQTTCTGAYTFYTHRRWSPQWGGELLVADEACEGKGLGPEQKEWVDWAGRKVARTEASSPHLEHEREDEVLGSVGFGRYVSPKPNRLVLIRGGVPHRINRVDPAAGDHVRCAVSGFFLRRPAEPGPSA